MYGIYRDKDGTPIGRRVDDGFIVDTDALTGETDAARDDKPKLCPDPEPDWPHGSRERAEKYQTQITGLPPGPAIWLNGVSFDGCRESDGTMLEAKGPGYDWVLNIKKEREELDVCTQITDQARRRSAAAGTRAIEWHFAEKSVADFFRIEFEERKLGMTVLYTPAASND